MKKLTIPLANLILFAFVAIAPAKSSEKFITLASTTSTQDSGFFSHILPLFEKKSGIKVRVVAVGTGQAIRIARNGDADVLLVHHKPSELDFVKEGYGVRRFDVMYNDFVIVGDKSDPARISGKRNAIEALKKVAQTKSKFVSRGDNSGTHKKELELWTQAQIDAETHSGKWYLEIGSGMGIALNFSSSKGAYTLSDRGTWLSFNNKGGLKLLVEGDKSLFNPYGVILVNPKKYPHIKSEEGQMFIDWLISDEGQAAIASFRKNGELLFYPNAKSNS